MRDAIKYMGERDERRISVRASAAPRHVRIEVEDTGPGLPPGLGSKSVFEPYVRGKGHTQPGIGLRLATVKRIAQSHGGAVGAQRARPRRPLLGRAANLPRAPGGNQARLGVSG